MSRLRELLDEHEEKLLDAWARSVENAGASDGIDACASFLSELKDVLRGAGSVDSASEARPSEFDEVAESGLDAVTATQAYGSLQRFILQLAADQGIALSPADQLALATQVNAAILRAAASQTRKHERELRHIAHQLRNPLGSALLALNLLRSRTDPKDTDRLREVIERNLLRVQGLVDEAVGEGQR
jgi:signal transduction histidine kinase